MDASERLRIVVCGLIAQYPLGGVTWDYLQYALGLRALGHDVYYLEDTGQWPYNPSEDGTSAGCDFNVRYLAGIMDRFGFRDRWCYRFPWGPEWFGLEDRRRTEILDTADLIINVSGTLRAPGELGGRARLVYVDSDPVFTQVKLARGQEDFRALVDCHDVHFTFAERGRRALPETGHDWLPTRQPIALDEWTHDEKPRDVFTTVMNWTSYNAIEFEGRSYGQKDVELRRFLDLPLRVDPTQLEIALSAGKNAHAPVDLLRYRGWQIVEPAVVCADLESYRHYIQSSMAEWSVAKNGYVVGNAGWFSCRSACYLAAGRPVVVQETGFSEVFPTGVGIVAFSTPEEAADAVRDVEARYETHSNAARELAAALFDGRSVLACLVERALEARPRHSTAP
jgi:hypothetical protein